MTSHAAPPSDIPRLAGPPQDLRGFSAPWKMRQAWLSKPERGFLAGEVRMAWEPRGLRVVADLPDREVFSESSSHGQKLWMLGDVFEIFLQREGSSRYLELHVSPNNHRLHLRWSSDSFQRVREGAATVEDVAGDPHAFGSEVIRLPRGGGWRVIAFVPASIVPGGKPFREGDLLRMSLSRYDADGNGGNPILSSTSPHEAASYHRRHEWLPARLGAAR